MNEKGAWFAIISSIILLSGITSITIYQDVFAASEKITICHKPGTPAEQTMDVPSIAVEGHLGHGDTMGACDQVPPPPTTGFSEIQCDCQFGGTTPPICVSLFCNNGGKVDMFCADYCPDQGLGSFTGDLVCRTSTGCALP